MVEADNKRSIECPKCGEKIDVSEILYHQVKENLQKSFNSRLAEEKQKYEEKAAALDTDRQALDEAKENQQSEIQQRVKIGVEAEKQKLESQIRKSVDEEKSEQFKSMQQELARKTEQVKELNLAKADRGCPFHS